MTASTDMSTPVTRGELRAELEQLEVRIDEKLDQKLDQKLAHLATKAELEIWGGALLARIESGEQRMLKAMIERIECSEQRLLTELARHVKAIQEAGAAQISVIDEKYADLPVRVNRLETTVFHRRKR